jgi:uncharacterized protein
MQANLNDLEKVALLLVSIGAINWGLVGLLDLNLVTFLLGGAPTLENLVYVLVGLAGLTMAGYLARVDAEAKQDAKEGALVRAKVAA